MTRQGVASQARQSMTMRVSIMQAVEAGNDDYGHPKRLKGSGQVAQSQVPCRAWVTTEQVDALDGTEQAAIEVLKIMVPIETVVSTANFVAGVFDRAGRVVYEGPLRILGVSRRPDHLIVRARAASGGRA